MVNNKVVGLRVTLLFKDLLFDYAKYKSEKSGYFRPLSSVIQEVMFEIMKNDAEFNEYLEKKGGSR